MPKSERRKKPENLAEAGFIKDEFINYYKMQFVPSILDEESFNQMIESFRISLPHVFRLNPIAHDADRVKSTLNTHFEELKKSNIEISKIEIFGDEFGEIYKMSIDNPNFRKNPALQPFREWLHVHEACGDFSRQELVSMIPPYFLDLKPEHYVLDMCAAPGSKTTQVLEMMLKQANGKPVEGIVVANEVNAKRCRTLAGRLQRLDNRQTIVTSHAGQQFPEITQFDRIVCDVPCSGDGTLRKSPDAGPNWRLSEGAGLHAVQRAILVKALRLLKIGGRCVYSTCSLNPIEDEAVVSSVLREMKGNVKIVDVSSKYPQLKRLPGLKSWHVCNDEKEFNNFSEVPEEIRKRVPETMFPVDVVEGIEHAMRFLPHLNDTGGFFVCVLEKTGEVTTPVPMNPRPTGKWPEPPFVQIERVEGEDIFDKLKAEYDLNDDILKKNCFARAEKSVHSIILMNEAASQIVMNAKPEVLRAVSCGARVFSWKRLKDDSAVHGTPCFDGIDVAFASSKNRKFAVTAEDMKKLLEIGNGGIEFNLLSENAGKEFSSSMRGGMFAYIEGTDIKYGGMISKNNVCLHIKKGVIPFEVFKLGEHFPELAVKTEGHDQEEKEEE